MRPVRIDQVVPSFGGRDAIGTHILHLRDLIRDLGFESDIWCKGAFPETRATRKVHRRPTRQDAPRTWWLYHLSSGSPVAELIAERPEPKMVDYHNITPASLFGSWVPWATEEADTGLRQLEDPRRRLVLRVRRLGVQRARPVRRRACRLTAPSWCRHCSTLQLSARRSTASWRRRCAPRRAEGARTGSSSVV